MDHRSVLSRAGLLGKLPKLNRGTGQPASPARPVVTQGKPADVSQNGRAEDAAGAAHVLRVDQAVFTSIRTPTGEGYRIIAATPGITVEEKTEITRRSPSHGALTGGGDAAVGLSCYPLPTGRYAVAWSRHAGKEHTARGGERVYTQVAVLSAEDYAGYACNPAWVHALIAGAVGDALVLKPPTRFELLALPRPDSPAARTAAPPPGRLNAGAIGCTLTTMHAVLGGGPLILAGCDQPWDTFTALVAALPMFARPGLSASIGVRFSPSRQFGLCLVERDQGETQRAVLGQAIALLDAARAGMPESGTHASWLTFVQDRLTAGQTRTLGDLAARMAEPMTGAALGQVVDICRDDERVATLSLADLLALHAKHAARRPDSRLAGELAAALLKRAAGRIEQLQQVEDEKQKSEAKA